MSDERLRELERRWKESAAVVDEAAYLRELLRTGVLSHDQLSLAAYCGHAAAELVLGTDAPPAPSNLVEWARGLFKWGKEAGVRAAIAAARHRLPDWETLGLNNNAPELAIALAERWLAVRSPELEAEAKVVSTAAWRAYKTNLGHGAAADAAAVACHAAESVMKDSAFAAGLAGEAVDAALSEGATANADQRERDLKSALRAALLCWALSQRPTDEPV